MLTVEYLLDNKDDIEKIAVSLLPEDIEKLVSLLKEKNDELRYTAFLSLQKRSRDHDDVYPYWDIFAAKMADENSYQRSIGIMLLAENVKWDKKNRLETIIEDYLSHCNDEKFITSRQTIQSIGKWICDKAEWWPLIIDKLTAIDIKAFKETQQKLILLDIIDVLLMIQKIQPSGLISDYVLKALSGGILDKKSVKLIEQKL